MTRYERLRAAGRCTTHPSRRPHPGFTKCRACIVYERKRHARRITQGQCTSCPEKATHGRKTCDGCAAKAMQRYHALRDEVLSHYCKGRPHCQCKGCRTVFIGFLQMDHVKGDGSTHFNEKGNRLKGPQLLFWLRAKGYPQGFQVHCANCNGPGGKGVRNRCPMYGRKH